jgi:hypothetical protein
MGLRAIDRFHKTRAGYLLFGLVELGLFLWLVNLAIPSGDWWEWLLAFLCLLGLLQNFGRMIVGAKK